MPRSVSGSKPTLRWHAQPRHAFSVRSVNEDRIAPPVGERAAGVSDAEEDDDTAKSRAGVESSG